MVSVPPDTAPGIVGAGPFQEALAAEADGTEARAPAARANAPATSPALR